MTSVAILGFPTLAPCGNFSPRTNAKVVGIDGLLCRSSPYSSNRGNTLLSHAEEWPKAKATVLCLNCAGMNSVENIVLTIANDRSW